MMNKPFNRSPWVRHLVFWLFALILLSYIYAIVFESFELGSKLILMLLPVHVLYFYLLDYFAVRHFYLRGKYVGAVLATIGILLTVAVIYRLVEIYITDPYIIRYYSRRDPNFTWEKIGMSAREQFFHPIYFVTAIERSNLVVWIGITLRLLSLSQERKQNALQAELDFLKAQLHPHFLFNSLNNIYSLALDKSDKTPEVVLGISNILRYSLYECTAQKVSLKRDIEVLEAYIGLEKLRYEDRLELNLLISGDRNPHRIAPLLMLPLVENAFKHGTGKTIDMPWINIQLHIDNNLLTLNISNSKSDHSENHPEQSGKIGVENLKKRLELIYPGQHELEFFDEEDCFITVLKLQLN
ncbi:MAG TPA: histidine kinase [Flavihumibacter sp.]|jgi:hypothetical protein